MLYGVMNILKLSSWALCYWFAFSSVQITFPAGAYDNIGIIECSFCWLWREHSLIKRVVSVALSLKGEKSTGEEVMSLETEV